MVWGIIGLLFFVLGMSLHKFKLYERIIGYDRMNDEEKEESQVKLISRYLAIICYILTSLALALFVTMQFSIDKAYSALLVLMVITFSWAVVDAPRYIRAIKDKTSQPVKFSNKNYAKLVRYLSAFGILLAFFVYMLLR